MSRTTTKALTAALAIAAFSGMGAANASACTNQAFRVLPALRRQ
jgi:hypothetical protein